MNKCRLHAFWISSVVLPRPNIDQKKWIFDDVSIFLIFNRSSLANDLIMKLC